MSIFLRSLIFNILFYLNLIILVLVIVPVFLLPRHGVTLAARYWGRSSNWLLRVICGTKIEVRGAERVQNIPLIVASKHQSIWETFTLVSMFPDPTFILKRELTWIPFFGWYLIKSRMIPIDRGKGSQVVPAMTARASLEINTGRQLLIFPEGTRRAIDAPPRYKQGVGALYVACNVPCLPVALNSGLCWPRRTFLRYPGTIIVEFLPEIPPGLPRDVFMARVENEIEVATARLVAEGRAELRAKGIDRTEIDAA